MKDRQNQPFRPNNAQSVTFTGYFQVPVTGPYRFYVEGKNDASIELRLGVLADPLLSGQPNGVGQVTELKSGAVYSLSLQARNLGGGDIRLLVQSEALPKGSADRLTLYPKTVAPSRWPSRRSRRALRLTLVREPRFALTPEFFSESIPSHTRAICRLIPGVRDPICRHPNKLGIRGLHADRPDPRRCPVRPG